MLGRKLQTKYQSVFNMRNDWDKFWDKRLNKPVNHSLFYKNFLVMKRIILNCLGLESLTGLKTLEIGAGRATISDFFCSMGCDTSCVDKYYRPSNGHDRHKFYVADAFDLPFPDRYFDVVHSYGLLEHFSMDKISWWKSEL